MFKLKLITERIAFYNSRHRGKMKEELRDI
jgi:hypothetical protein